MLNDVDRPLRTPDNLIQFPGGQDDNDLNPDDITVEVALEPGDEGYTEPEEEEAEPTGQDFDGNLAKHLDPSTLNSISLDLIERIEEDERSRDTWMENYKRSLKYLGIENAIRSEPWANACAVVHPGMLQGIVRFQSRALGKLFPSNGPCAIAVKGMEINPQLQLIINRAQELYNHHITNVMVETQTETDRLNFGLAQIGFAAKEVDFDDEIGRTYTQFVEAEDFLLPYGVDNLETAPRYTIKLRPTRNTVENMIKDGVYLDALPPGGTTESLNEVEEEKTKITGQDQEPLSEDHLRLYKIYTNYLIHEDEFKNKKGKRSSYIITIDKENEGVYCIKRNWKKDDPKRKKRVNYALYRYVPGDGSYGFGLVQLTGQLIIAATRILREVVDAGELANLPALFKSTHARMKSQGPLGPGEIRDIDLDPAQIKDAFFPLPFKEPSPALIQLLELIIGEIKAFSSTADLDISASSQNAPVGTTLALIERQTEISNAVQKRMHTSFSSELQLIAEFMKEYEEEVYAGIFGDLEKAVGQKGIIVLSASGDPCSSTMAQRVMQLQAVMQNSVQAPQCYDLPVLHRTYITAMGLTDALSIVPDKSTIQPMGIVEEIQALLNNKPVKAFSPQDHKSHIGALMAFLNDPMYQQILGKAPGAQQIVMATYALIAEHIAFEYQNEIQEEAGFQLPPPGTPLPPEIDQALSQMVAQAAGRVAQKHAAMAAQQAAAQQAADPAYQLEEKKLKLEEADSVAKHALAAEKLDRQDKQADEKNQLQFLQILTAAKNDQDVLEHAAAETTTRLGTELLGHAQHLNEMDHKQNELDHSKDVAAQDAELAKQQQQQDAQKPASGGE